MAGAGLIAIRRRIKSVTNTRKITKAMGLVATAKLKRTRDELEKNNKYFLAIEDIKDTLLSNIDEYEGIYLKGNSNKKLYIVLTSETGMCGSFNASVVVKTIDMAENHEEDAVIMVVGQKGRMYFRKTKYKTVAEYAEVPDIPTYKEALIIFNHLTQLLKAEEVGEIDIVYTKFLSPVRQDVVVEKLLPLESRNKNFTDNIIYEPNKEVVLEGVIESYLKGKILNAMLNSKVSEHGARMTSMGGATKNANDLLDKLKLRYNRIRQSAITQEISEIVGGAEAQR